MGPAAVSSHLLSQWLARALEPEQADWLVGQRERVRLGNMRAVHLAIGAASSRLKGAPLQMDADDLAAADAARRGWDPRGLDAAAAARILLMLDVADTSLSLACVLTELCATAAVGELTALYRGLPLYPQSTELSWQVGEGLRTSIVPVFRAIVHRSPYPAEQFDEERWNHMVLKALFMDVSLDPIQRFDTRRNWALACMARNYADERIAAGRPVSPELWRCVAPFVIDRDLERLAALAIAPAPTDRMAAALALSEASGPEVGAMLDRLSDQVAAIRAGTLTWSTVIGRSR